MKNPEEYTERGELKQELTRKEEMVFSFLKQREQVGMVKQLNRYYGEKELAFAQKKEKIHPKFEYVLDDGRRVLAMIRPGHHATWMKVKKLWEIVGESWLDAYQVVGNRIAFYDRAKHDPKLLLFFKAKEKK